MQSEFEIKTPSLAASTELLVMAPIRRGFVPSLDTITYKSRTKLLLKALHAGRQSQHEYRPLRAMSDAVERVGVIRSLRVAVVEGRSDIDDRILLSVHFDGSYEAYVRTIWQRAARLLDLIFCNSEAYVTGWDHPFDDWNAWIRSVQVSTPFFYATPGITYADQTYLQMLERRDRGGAEDELMRTRIAVPTAEEVAWSIVVNQGDPTKRAVKEPPVGPMARTEVFRQNLGALAGIYRLADWYRPGTADGEVLRHAAHELLPQLRDMFLSDPSGLGATAGGIGGERLARALAWFVEELESVPPARAGSALPDDPPSPLPERDVQGGILAPYDGVSDAVMVLVNFGTAAGAATLLEGLNTTSAGGSDTPVDQVLVNLALTHEGLRACGLTQAELEQWPLEFRQGMAARAGLLGDVRWNHPNRWTLPRYNGALKPDPDRDDSALPPVPLESVHAVLQFRLRPASAEQRDTARSVLASAVQGLGKIAGIGLLSVQWLARQFDGEAVVDHFGYTDGQSQPELGRNPKASSLYNNQVHLGEVLVGYTNAADREEDQAVNRDPRMRALMRNGSFLVVRKLRQRVASFRAAVAATQDRTGIDEKAIRAHMMGRWPADAGQDAGKPLAPLGEGGINDFSYRDDAEGLTTPLAAHIRRANPREVTEPNDYPKPAPGGRAPRILRRSLPYGPRSDRQSPDNADRGLMFMAYGASLAEQFEVIQGWLAGGNSSRGYSGAGCPFLGVPEAGRERNFRFVAPDRKTTVHMSVDGCDDLGTEPEPLVTLQWGLYAFAPSHTAKALLAQRARKAVVAAALPWSADRGEELIRRLRSIEDSEGQAAGSVAWKAALEDPDALARYDSASIWAAVRALHGGVLRIPHGVLVAAPELVDAVLQDEARFTVDGYRRRLVAAGMGPIYLGRDASDPEYALQSQACNRAIEAISMEEGYRDARAAARDLLSGWIRHAISVAEASGELNWELSLDSRDLIAGTLATLGERWFGLDDRTSDHTDRPFFQRGAMDWQWRPGDPVYYPGHFTAASRATFQAMPSDHVTALAAEHGTALTAALWGLVETKGVEAFAQARVSKDVLEAFWRTRPDVAIQNIAGALMGLLPTTEGILRRVLPEWTRAGTLLELAGRASGHDLDDWAFADALLGDALRRAIKFKPVPEQVWREATVAHRLGAPGEAGERVQPGEKLIIGQVSALHAQLEQGDTADLYAAFGGRRGPGQPTHACPGYRAAVGAMMGMLSATLARSEGQLAPSTSPGVLVFRGRTPNPEIIVQGQFRALGLFSALPGQGQKLLAFGDSWLRFEEEDHATGGDFRRSLAALGYDTREFDNMDHAHRGRTLAKMAEYKPNDSRSVYARLRDLIKTGAPPLAVLVSGGGNDFVDGTHPFPKLDCAKFAGLNSRLDAVVKKQSESPQHSEQALLDFLADMKKHLTAIVSNLAAAGSGADGKQLVPIIVVAYDHPVPDGRAWRSAFTCPWLRPVFGRKAYSAPDSGGQGDSSSLMSSFITRLNLAYGEVADALSKQGVLVRHVPLTGVLAKYQSAHQLSHQDVWKNELHPTKLGFDVLAQHLHDVALKPLFSEAPVS